MSIVWRLGSRLHGCRRVSTGELMDAVGGSNTFAGRHVLTKLTLSLLEDTGWWGPRLACLFYSVFLSW